jgi:hypothetical protein
MRGEEPSFGWSFGNVKISREASQVCTVVLLLQGSSRINRNQKWWSESTPIAAGVLCVLRYSTFHTLESHGGKLMKVSEQRHWLRHVPGNYKLPPKIGAAE